MTDERSEAHKGTLYLDVDGVIFPLQDDDHCDPAEAKWVNHVDHYHPGVVRALGELPARVIIASSRGSEFLDGQYDEINDVLDTAGSALPQLEYAASLDAKLRTLAAHHYGAKSGVRRAQHSDTTPVGEKIVWVDDIADAEKLARIRSEHVDGHGRMLDEPGLLIVQPDGRYGLTHEHVQTIRDFLDS